MTTRRPRTLRLGVFLAASAIIVAACSSDKDSSGTTATTVASSTTAAGSTSATTAGGSTPSSGGEVTAASAAPTTVDPNAKDGGTLRARVAVNPSSLDPQAGPSGSDHVMLYPIYDTLVNFDLPTLSPEPGLAESWTYTDPTTLELKIRSGVKFQDGSTLDAAAVKASLDRFKTQTNKADLANVTSVDAPDASTVVLHLAQPDSSLVLVLADRAGMIVGPTATTDSDGFAQHPVGAGPYKFVSYDAGNKLEVERWDGYWNPGSVHVDKIDFMVMTDPKAAANALQSGQIDFSDSLDTADIDSLKGNGKLHTQVDSGVWFNMMYLNLAQKPLDDERVRTAINLAVDRDELIAGVTDGAALPATLPLPPSHWAYDETNADPWPHDVDKAKQLMADAGYGDGVKVTMVTSTDAPSQRQAEILKDELGKIGIDLQVTTMDVNQGVQQYFEAQAFNSAVFAWSGRPDPSQTYNRLFSKDTYQNPGKVAIPGLDDAINETVSTDDLAERQEAFVAANKILNAAAPYVPLFFRPNVTSFSANVQGYVPSLLGKPKVEYLWLSD